MISGDDSVDKSASISTKFFDVDADGGASSYSQLFPDEEFPFAGFRLRIPFRIVLLPPEISQSFILGSKIIKVVVSIGAFFL